MDFAGSINRELLYTITTANKGLVISQPKLADSGISVQNCGQPYHFHSNFAISTVEWNICGIFKLIKYFFLCNIQKHPIVQKRESYALTPTLLCFVSVTEKHSPKTHHLIKIKETTNKLCIFSSCCCCCYNFPVNFRLKDSTNAVSTSAFDFICPTHKVAITLQSYTADRVEFLRRWTVCYACSAPAALMDHF